MAQPTGLLRRLFKSTLISGLLLNGAAAYAVDLGNASVMSMQGQRLKIAVPYGSAPGERVPVMRFAVQSVEALDGRPAPAASDFVISQPEFRNVVYLQSREPVAASKVKLVLSVGNDSAKQVAYDLAIPPLAYASTPVEAVAAKSDRPMRTAKRKARPVARAPMASTPKASTLLKGQAKGCSC